MVTTPQQLEPPVLVAPRVDDLTWLSRLMGALGNARGADSLARTTIEAVCRRLDATSGAVVVENAGALIHELCPSRYRTLASYGDLDPTGPALAPAIEVSMGADSGRCAQNLSLMPFEAAHCGRGVLAVRTGDDAGMATLDAAARLLAYALGNAALQSTSTLDPRTGLPRAMQGLQDLRTTLMLGARNKTPCGLVAFQVDDYAEIAESYGRAAADLITRAVARSTRSACRRTDQLSHHAEGSFLLTLPATPLTGALKVAESLRDYLSAVRVDFEGRELSVTISAGVASVDVGLTDARNLTRRAIDAMNSSRIAGGNRVTTGAPC